MHVGSVGSGWGASRLWHDPNYEISRDYRPIPVQRGVNDAAEALPHEDHLAPPEKPQDPFSVQESAYDVAAAQMNRGVEGQKLLAGQKDPKAYEAALSAAHAQRSAQEATRVLVMDKQAAHNPGQPGAVVKPQEHQVVAPGQQLKPQGSASTSSDREAQVAAKDASDSSELVDAVAMGAGGFGAAAGAAKLAAVVGATQAVGSAAALATTATGGAVAADHEHDPVHPDAANHAPKG